MTHFHFDFDHFLKAKTISGLTFHRSVHAEVFWLRVVNTLYIKEDESSPSMNSTKLIFFYDELEANVTLLTQTVGPDCLENLYLINTNIETIRQGKLQLIGNRTDELGGHLLNINLNDKFISIYMEHNFPTPTSLSIKFDGPWGRVELQGKVFSTNLLLNL